MSNSADASQGAVTVSCIGAGSIGASWAAHFLRAGLKVVSFDSAPERQRYLREAIDFAWPTLERLGLHPGASKENLTFTTDLETAVEDADFVQESVFEDVEVKSSVIGKLDQILPAHVIIASSSSGFLASQIAARCTNHPERVIIGHPFNPVYLVPLVEIAAVAGPQTDTVVQRAKSFYERYGQKTIVLKREINGFVANRLQYAIWKEVLYLLSQDIASVEDIDNALTYGPGVRWASMGPSSVFFLGGRTRELFHSFVVDELWREAVAYGTPGDFTPDQALIDKYIQGVQEMMREQDFEGLRERRDREVTAIRVALNRK